SACTRRPPDAGPLARYFATIGRTSDSTRRRKSEPLGCEATTRSATIASRRVLSLSPSRYKTLASCARVRARDGFWAPRERSSDAQGSLQPIPSRNVVTLFHEHHCQVEGADRCARMVLPEVPHVRLQRRLQQRARRRQLPKLPQESRCV